MYDVDNSVQVKYESTESTFVRKHHADKMLKYSFVGSSVQLALHEKDATTLIHSSITSLIFLR